MPLQRYPPPAVRQRLIAIVKWVNDMEHTPFAALDKIHKRIQWKEENNIREWLIRIAGFVEERQKQCYERITPERAELESLYGQIVGPATYGIPGNESPRSCGTPSGQFVPRYAPTSAGCYQHYTMDGKIIMIEEKRLPYPSGKGFIWQQQ